MERSADASIAPRGSPCDHALALAAASREESVAALAALVRVPSLTGEEGAAQQQVAARLGDPGAEVSQLELDIAALFARFPNVAQYPTHWRHDLILPYAELPTYTASHRPPLDGTKQRREFGFSPTARCRARSDCVASARSRRRS